MDTLFDLDVLRTFLEAVDSGSLARAAARVGRTPSAVSLQMRRLQELVEPPLFRKAGRGLALTPGGELLAGYARRLLALNAQALAALREEPPPEVLRVGAPQDVAERWLPAALGRFARGHAELRLELRVDHGAALAELQRRGQLDLCVRFALGEGEAFTTLGALPTSFLAARSFILPRGEPLPLALLEAPCVFRRAALQALDAASMPWRIAVSASSVSVLWSAVAAGLGVTARAAIAAPASLRALGPRQGLPALPQVTLSLCGGESGSPALRALRSEIAAELSARLRRRR
jgi:DNA-binding transcriptional LysR family regulator